MTGAAAEPGAATAAGQEALRGGGCCGGCEGGGGVGGVRGGKGEGGGEGEARAERPAAGESGGKGGREGGGAREVGAEAAERLEARAAAWEGTVA